MEIKTITCHDVYNYGASLQAYALQRHLENLGHHVEIIDYLPDYLNRRYHFLSVSPNSKLYRLAKIFYPISPIIGIWQNRRELKFWKRKKRFDEFKKNYLKTTCNTYRSFDELQTNKPEADLYIAGSDQIWNTQYSNGKDPAFYCLFEDDKRKCISYAASFGTHKIYKGYEEFVKKGLSNFRAISIREQTGVQIAKSLNYNAQLVIDPVFLLENSDWINFCKFSKIKEKYVLVYDFLHNDSRIKELAVKLASKGRFKIYSINDISSLPYADKNINDAGPIEFLQYIYNAQIIISTSFHATAFSVIFEKEFYTLPLIGHSNSSRMKDFLSSLNLNERFISEKLKEDYKPIDYSQSSLKLRTYIETSKKWLSNNLYK